VLNGQFKDGDTVDVDVEKGQVVFLKEEQRAKK
jgi:hypothetical protein